MKILKQEIEWYDIKTKTKKIIRSFFYSSIIQSFTCLLLVFYLKFVYFSSRKKLINIENFSFNIKKGSPIILAVWHNRLAMIPFFPTFAKKINKNYQFMTLASHHGDGKFAGRVMNYFGFENIYGSSQNGRKKSRGIDFSSTRQIIHGLKNGKGLGITPDGPRGPNQKINSEVISIAKISGAKIIPVSYSSSHFFQFNSWDKFKFPLPFSRLCFVCGNEISIAKNIDASQEKLLKTQLENEMNLVQEKSFQALSS